MISQYEQCSFNFLCSLIVLTKDLLYYFILCNIKCFQYLRGSVQHKNGWRPFKTLFPVEGPKSCDFVMNTFAKQHLLLRNEKNECFERNCIYFILGLWLRKCLQRNTIILFISLIRSVKIFYFTVTPCLYFITWKII